MSVLTVRLCEHPGCEGPAECPDVRYDRRTIGATLNPPKALADDEIVRLFQQELTLGYVTDSTGAKHMMPADAVFIVHSWLEGGPKPPAAVDIPGNIYCATYTGERELDDLLAGSPEYDWELVTERLAELKATGGV